MLSSTPAMLSLGGRGSGGGKAFRGWLLSRMHTSDLETTMELHGNTCFSRLKIAPGRQTTTASLAIPPLLFLLLLFLTFSLKSASDDFHPDKPADQPEPDIPVSDSSSAHPGPPGRQRATPQRRPSAFPHCEATREAEKLATARDLGCYSDIKLLVGRRPCLRRLAILRKTKPPEINRLSC